MHFGVVTSQKIPLIRLGRINGQKTFDGRIFGGFGGGGLTHKDLKFGRKKHFNLQSVKLTFSFSSIKHVFRHFSRRARCEICSKLTYLGEHNNRILRYVVFISINHKLVSDITDVFYSQIIF